MRFWPPRGRVTPVSDATRLTFVLEIDSGSQPIRGRLTEEDRGSIEFGGWMGLASALERLIERPAAPPPADRRAEQDPRSEQERTG
jgi:hypothetical protein